MPTVRPGLVGGFVLGAIALTVAGILFFGGTRLFTRSATAVVFFNGSIAGLDVGAPVTFRGMRIGIVEHVSLHFSMADLTARIPVFLKIQPERIVWAGKPLDDSGRVLRRMVEAGLRAQLAIRSFITGQVAVDLDFRPDTPAALVGAVPDVPEIPSIPSAADKVVTELTTLPLGDIAKSTLHALGTVDRLAADLDRKLDPLGQDAHRVMTEATRTLETADQALRQLQADAAVMLRGWNATAMSTQRQVDERGEELGRVLVTADRTAHELDSVVNALNGLIAPRTPFRGDLESAARDLSASAGSLRSFARTLERNPSALLSGKSMP